MTSRPFEPRCLQCGHTMKRAPGDGPLVCSFDDRHEGLFTPTTLKELAACRQASAMAVRARRVQEQKDYVADLCYRNGKDIHVTGEQAMKAVAMATNLLGYEYYNEVHAEFGPDDVDDMLEIADLLLTQRLKLENMRVGAANTSAIVFGEPAIGKTKSDSAAPELVLEDVGAAYNGVFQKMRGDADAEA